jgi:hypothetical protein
MGEINSRGLIYIDFSGGNFKLTKVKTWDIEDDKKVDVVTSATLSDGAGFREKPGGGKITFEVFRESPTPEVNYRRLRSSREKFTITIQDEDGGLREQYQKCRVSTVKRKGDDEGSNMDTVEIVFLKGPVELPR